MLRSSPNMERSLHYEILRAPIKKSKERGALHVGDTLARNPRIYVSCWDHRPKWNALCKEKQRELHVGRASQHASRNPWISWISGSPNMESSWSSQAKSKESRMLGERPNMQHSLPALQRAFRFSNMESSLDFTQHGTLAFLYTRLSNFNSLIIAQHGTLQYEILCASIEKSFYAPAREAPSRNTHERAMYIHPRTQYYRCQDISSQCMTLSFVYDYKDLYQDISMYDTFRHPRTRYIHELNIIAVKTSHLSVWHFPAWERGPSFYVKGDTHELDTPTNSIVSLSRHLISVYDTFRHEKGVLSLMSKPRFCCMGWPRWVGSFKL